MNAFLKAIEVGGINLAASELEAHETQVEAAIETTGATGLDGLVKLVEKDDAALPVFARVYLNTLLNTYEPQIQALLPTVAGTGVPQLVAALRALAAKIQAS